MTDALQTNALDAVAALATQRALEVLSLLGQCPERGYRAALACLRDKEPGTWSSPEWLIEKAMAIINLVVYCADLLAMADEKLADLVAFFIQRMRFAEFSA
jgi:hypothetical protein